MRQSLPLLALAAGLAVAPVAAAAQNAVTLKSVNVQLPTGDRIFSTPGSDAVNNNCLGCHSAGMILDQPALPKATWAAEVEKMRQIYKAPIEPKDVDAIVDYLVSIKGTS
ncbi:MAG TPA: cytochrome c [Stellaceae bacterium]|nr:cytochrome c [Stellaceae bacterium]